MPNFDRPSDYTTQARYCACVLSVHGYSYAEVAVLLQRYRLTLRMTRQQVEGIVRRCGVKKGTRRERQATLDLLSTDRRNGGILAAHVFKAV